ncbi:MAG: threonine synthase [Verrucomicrobia bacterium]|nr:threonine synthase [Verrucomicrobiota bacterium]
MSWGGIIQAYRDRLPLPAGAKAITLLEGNTPLVPGTRLAATLKGDIDLRLKYEGLNPTASFKDRGMTMAITHALAKGVQLVICASTGNTSASAAAYAARAGLACAVILPAGKIALGKLTQAMIHGAKLLPILGNFDDALDLVRQMSSLPGVEVVNSINPVRIEGQKTAAFEILETLGKTPDFHFLPVGNAGNITAYWKGFCEALPTGPRPRMFGWQAAGAAPLVDGHIVKDPQTIATAIRIGNPASGPGALAAVKESNGRIDKVTDEEILDAYQLLARTEGIFVEPACAAPVAGLRKAIAAGWIPPGSLVTMTLTGHGLKDPDTALSVIPKPAAPIAPTLDAARKALGL